MDDQRFDGLARQLSAEQSRRNALRIAGAGVVSGLIPALFRSQTADAADLSAQACNPTGTRCGRKRKGRRRQPACTKCCSKYTSTQRNGQRRCSCMPDFIECKRSDQCCSGLCIKVQDICGCEADDIPPGFPTTPICIPGWFVELLPVV